MNGLAASTVAGGVPAKRPFEGIRLRLASAKLEVSSDCPEVLEALVSLYPAALVGAMELEGAPSISFTVAMEDGAEGLHYRIFQAGLPLHDSLSASEAVAHLESLLNLAAADHTPDKVLVHAGVVSRDGRGVMIPGGSGAGKSTLVAALALSGFEYLTDELAVLDRETATVMPFPRVLCLKEGGWQALATTLEVPPPLLRADRADGETVIYLAPSRCVERGAPVSVAHLLFPVRRPGGARLARLHRATALAELARNSVNLPGHGRAGLETLARLVEESDCYTLSYGDLREAVAVISSL